MRYFVTGATGFIGGHLCARLAANGHEVFALVRRPSSGEGLRRIGVQVIKGDLALL